MNIAMNCGDPGKNAACTGRLFNVWGVRIAAPGLLIAALSFADARAQTPPEQPDYPASPEQHRTNPAQRTIDPATTDREPRCDNLSGLERSECERRDITNDDAPAGVTTSMQEEEKRRKLEQSRRAQSEATAAPTSNAESDADTARENPPRSNTRMRQATRDRMNQDDSESTVEDSQSEDALNNDTMRREQGSESNSEVDTLSPPRR